jgi:lysophospholipase L1-like esterase
VAVTFTPPATRGGVAPVHVSCTRESGTMFAVGTTPVQCTARDAASVASSCTFTVTVTVPPRVSRTRFLAFGDSLTEGEITVPAAAGAREGTLNRGLVIVPAASYPTQLEAQLRSRYALQRDAIQVINAGRSGEWAEDGALRLPGLLSSLRPEALLLLHGYNELGALGDPGINRAWQALDTMAKDARHRGMRVFIATLPPPRVGAPKALPTSLVTTFNNRIRTTAAGEGAVLVDVYGALLPDVLRYVGVDGLHLNEAGYRRVSELFFDAIRGDLEVR